MRFYSSLSRVRGLNYPAKILLVTFLGIHLPLISVVAVALVFSLADWGTVLLILAVLLAATLIGTACTLLVLYDLLAPILAASRALRDYRQSGRLPVLPLDFDDEAGTLMRDTDSTIRELDELVRKLTDLDAESGLPNRNRLRQLIDDQLAARKRIAVVCLLVQNRSEIDYFFDVPTGRELLAAFVERLRDEPSVLEVGRVAPGIIKFSMPLQERSDLEDALSALSERLSRPLTSGDYAFYPRLLLGVARPPEDGARADALMSAAMTATKNAEPDAESNVLFYSAESQRSARRLFEMDQEIRTAIETGQFELHYQPIVEFDRRRVVSAEALIRWRHPERGLIPPNSFIPLAEGAGLIIPLGQWILETACRQAAEMGRSLVETPRLSINMSARQFSDPDLLSTLDRAVEAAGIAHDALKFEITETVVVTDLKQARRTIAALKERGIAVVLDDFGAEHSNLRYIANIDFDEMKIDRQFVSHIDADSRLKAICTSILTLAEGLGVPVVAEGVERREELDTLHRLGCRQFQGYLFSRPIPAGQFPDAVRTLVTEIADPGFAMAPSR